MSRKDSESPQVDYSTGFVFYVILSLSNPGVPIRGAMMLEQSGSLDPSAAG